MDRLTLTADEVEQLICTIRHRTRGRDADMRRWLAGLTGTSARSYCHALTEIEDSFNVQLDAAIQSIGCTADREVPQCGNAA